MLAFTSEPMECVEGGRRDHTSGDTAQIGRRLDPSQVRVVVKTQAHPLTYTYSPNSGSLPSLVTCTVHASVSVQLGCGRIRDRVARAPQRLARSSAGWW